MFEFIVDLSQIILADIVLSGDNALIIGMAAASFFALAYTFVEGGHIRITLFLEKTKNLKKYFLELWCLSVASFFSGYLAFYFSKMLLISYEFQERSEGADEILIWIPQISVSFGSLIFFICVFHQLVLKHI